MIPREPTEEMIAAGENAQYHGDQVGGIWRAMHDAANGRLWDSRPNEDQLRDALLKFAVSRHTNKCYLCETSWSDGAPDIHTDRCLLARPGHCKQSQS